MRKIFSATRGQNRLPQLNDSLAIYFNVTYKIQDRIQREYSKPTYDHAKPGQYLLARSVVLKELKGLLTVSERTELEAFHNRRCRRWRKAMLLSDGEEDADGDIDDELDDEEQAKFDEEKRKAVEREAKEAAEDIADAPLEDSVVDVEAIIEYVPTFHLFCLSLTQFLTQKPRERSHRYPAARGRDREPLQRYHHRFLLVVSPGNWGHHSLEVRRSHSSDLIIFLPGVQCKWWCNGHRFEFSTVAGWRQRL
jgi:hypothetical protein